MSRSAILFSHGVFAPSFAALFVLGLFATTLPLRAQTEDDPNGLHTVVASAGPLTARTVTKRSEWETGLVVVDAGDEIMSRRGLAWEGPGRGRGRMPWLYQACYEACAW